MWLGTKRGYLQDWITQLWVEVTGKRITLNEYPWLYGPVGQTDKIGDQFVQHLAEKESLRVVKEGAGMGLLNSLRELNLPDHYVSMLNPRIKDFYTSTDNYDFEVWSTWKGLCYPFGSLLNLLFSKRLQQLNLPLDPLDSSRGIESNIWKLYSEDNPVYTIWYRILKSTKNVIYSGVYSTLFLPSIGETCLKVIFPLPNGNATVIMKIRVQDDGSLLLISEGRNFGDPGFYFFLTNHDNTTQWAKYVRAMHETIHVYEDEANVLRTDHVLKFYGSLFLKLHYRINPKVTINTMTNSS